MDSAALLVTNYKSQVRPSIFSGPHKYKIKSVKITDCLCVLQLALREQLKKILFCFR